MVRNLPCLFPAFFRDRLCTISYLAIGNLLGRIFRKILLLMNRPLLLLLALLLLGLPAGLFLISRSLPPANILPAAPASPGPDVKQASMPVPEETDGRSDDRGGEPESADLPKESAPGDAAAPARPGATRVPTKAEEPLAGAPPPLPLGPDFLEAMVDESGTAVSFALPGGEMASGTVELLERDANGILLVQGRLDSPEPGFYFFQRQTEPGVLGSFFGHARFDEGDIAYRAEPVGPGGTPMLVARRLDQVVCVELPLPPPESEPEWDSGSAPAPAPGTELEGPVAAPQTHPVDIPIPGYQSIVPLQSLPGASAVVFLDFEGGEGPWAGWGDFPVAPAESSNSQVREIWQRVSEDFQPFNVNITTDRMVFENARRNSRQRVMVTRTDTASPGNGGVANYWTFNATSDIVCWAFYTVGKSAAEVISHEIGHTMGLSHDGREHPDEPREEYYDGHDAGKAGWAPIMGVGYNRVLSQWSKGEYPYPTNREDDLAIITNNNNRVDYRNDDHGSDHTSASYLEIFADGTVANEGIVERSTTVDAFRFATGGGAISLRVRPVSAGPNLDILAELRSAQGEVLTYDNPTEEIAATIDTTVTAGEYTLRVRSTGYPARGGYGYSDYATLGAYLISGTVENGVLPDRFSVAENSAAGSVVGTVTRRNNHGRRPLIYAIESGNEDGAFSIASSNGEITVADPSLLDFEALSTQWDDLATMELLASITNPDDPALNELVRVVVTVTDENEPPVLNAASLAMFSGTAEGTELMRIEATDPDHFDFPVFSIVSGNPDGAFGVDPSSGRLFVADSLNVASETTYPLVVQAMDQGTPPLATEATIHVTVFPLDEAYIPGTIVRTYFEGVTGTSVSNLLNHAKFPDNPDSEEFLPSFSGHQHGNSYGSTMRAYLLVPKTGNYRFWIASDDGGQLLFNKLPSRDRAVERATVPGHTNPYQYDKYPEQRSELVALTAGQVCYIEARQKEGGGDDHVSVAWEGPGFLQEVIPGRYLAPYYQNYAPKIPDQSFAVREGAYEGRSVGVVAVTDVNATESHHSFQITGGTGFGIFEIDADSGRITIAKAGAFSAGQAFTLDVRTQDSGSRSRQGSGTVTVNVLNGEAVAAPDIIHQIWDKFTGETVAALESDARFPGSPSRSRAIGSFNVGQGLGDSYGSRVRAYLIPPTTGRYRFYISSDDHSELRFSTSSDPAEAVAVASVSGSVPPDAWAEQRSQISAEFSLVGGARYYIEVLHRQGVGGDHLKVGWMGPEMSAPTVIPGKNLQPFDINAPPLWEGAPYAFTTYAGAPEGTEVGRLRATDPEGAPLIYAILGDNEGGAFRIDPATGVLSVADGSALAAGESVNLDVGVQDDGTGGVYPFKSVETTVVIGIGGIDSWRAEKFGGDAGDPVIAGDDADPDGDGFKNLLEYALGLDPLAANGSGALVLETETADGQTYLRLIVTKNAAAMDVMFNGEVTGDASEPASWSDSDAIVESDGPTTLIVRDTVPFSAASARFIRLKVTR